MFFSPPPEIFGWQQTFFAYCGTFLDLETDNRKVPFFVQKLTFKNAIKTWKMHVFILFKSKIAYFLKFLSNLHVSVYISLIYSGNKRKIKFFWKKNNRPGAFITGGAIITGRAINTVYTVCINILRHWILLIVGEWEGKRDALQRSIDSSLPAAAFVPNRFSSPLLS
jgi:hypothetical protein